MKPKTMVAIIVTALIVIISVQNIQAVEVKFIIWQLTISRVHIILGSFMVGILVGVLISKKIKKKPRLLTSA